jgi:hypothetical protein
LAIAFAFGARTGVLIPRMPSLAKTASKARVNSPSRSRIRKRKAASRSRNLQSDCEEVDREHALGLLPQERSPGQGGALAGSTASASRRIFRTVVAATFEPSPLVSPAIRW